MYKRFGAGMASGLIRNSAWNAIGQVVPAAFGLVLLPGIFHSLSPEKFGFLSLAWVLVGMFGLLDLGISRSMTHAVATIARSETADQLHKTATTGFWLLTSIGTIAGCLAALLYEIAGLSPAAIPPGEAKASALLLCASVPFVTGMQGLRGVLEGMGRFGAVNKLRIPAGIGTFAGPYLALWVLPNSLDAAIAGLFCSRVLALLLFYRAATEASGAIFKRGAIDRATVVRLLKFGSWVSVSNVLSPLMTNLDRFIIGRYVSLAAVGAYTVPFDAITKLLLVPAAIAGAAFPSFVKHAHEDPREVRRLSQFAITLLASILVPIVLIIALFGKALLALWIDLNIANTAAPLIIPLCIGVLANALAHIPFGLIQAYGKPNWTAKAHLVEAAAYLPLLFLLTVQFGIQGAAWAWACRATLDLAILSAIARRLDLMRLNKPAQLCLGVLMGVLLAVAAAHEMRLTTH
jgi:O-antigen/teichoic acid export membrane protein